MALRWPVSESQSPSVYPAHLTYARIKNYLNSSVIKRIGDKLTQQGEHKLIRISHCNWPSYLASISSRLYTNTELRKLELVWRLDKKEKQRWWLPINQLLPGHTAISLTSLRWLNGVSQKASSERDRPKPRALIYGHPLLLLLLLLES